MFPQGGEVLPMSLPNSHSIGSQLFSAGYGRKCSLTLLFIINSLKKQKNIRPLELISMDISKNMFSVSHNQEWSFQWHLIAWRTKHHWWPLQAHPQRPTAGSVGDLFLGLHNACEQHELLSSVYVLRGLKPIIQCCPTFSSPWATFSWWERVVIYHWPGNKSTNKVMSSI